MNIIFSGINKIFQQLRKSNQKVYKLFEQLTYGKELLIFDKNSKLYLRTFFYLNQKSAEMLICLELKSSKSHIFNLLSTRIEISNYKYEMEYGLEQERYIVLIDSPDEVIISFKNNQEREDFYKSLKEIGKTFVSKLRPQFDPVILKNFIKSDINSDEQLTLSELKCMLKEMKVEYNDKIKGILQFIEKQNKTNRKQISYKDFEKLVRIFSCRDEFISIFQTYTKVSFAYYNYYLQKLMDIKQFKHFLSDVQHENQSTKVDAIIKTVFNDKQMISFYQFCVFLNSPINNVHHPELLDYQTNLEQPLNQYYCYSSHNTYLTGNQLTSQSRAERYWQDLSEGIRCVQLDTHDGDNEPIIKHGYTITKSITFLSAIKIIAKFSDEWPHHTPIILSIENHCNNSNQLKMAEILIQNFKDKILRVRGQTLPTLKQCLGKIVVKCGGTYKLYQKYIKNPKQEEGEMVSISKLTQIFSNTQIQLKEEDEKKEVEQTMFILQQVISEQIQSNNTPSSFIKYKGLFQSMKKTLKDDKEKFTKKSIQIASFIRNNYQSHQEVSEGKHSVNLALLSLTSMFSKGKFGQPCAWESISVSESKLKDYYQNHKNQFINHGNNSWIRAYPEGTRFDSSNYDPICALQLGVSIIALNTQYNDPYTHIMRTFFQKGSNNCIGYRQKSQNMKQHIGPNKIISISVVSCSNVYQNNYQSFIPNVQILMSFIGTVDDMERNPQFTKHRKYTQSINGNAYNPIFRKSQRMTLCIKDISFAFVFMQIEDCGIAIINLREVQKGYRNVSLYDDHHHIKNSKIMVLIE